jgi:cytidylate kinase
MHLSSKLIIAIFGPSCVGKTTLARVLGAKLGIPIRSCGTVLREEAFRLGISLDSISLEVHHRIDAETRNFAEQATGSTIIEGRYLDVVLIGATPNMKLI